MQGRAANHVWSELDGFSTLVFAAPRVHEAALRLRAGAESVADRENAQRLTPSPCGVYDFMCALDAALSVRAVATQGLAAARDDL